MMPTITASRAGRPIVVILKARPRTCSRYSRFAIKSMLRIGLAPHGLDEYLLERRLDQFESIDGGHGCRLAQQLLRVAVFLELDLGMAAEVLRLGNFAAVQECRAPLKFDNHAVAFVARLDLAHLAGQHRLAFVDQADRV